MIRETVRTPMMLPTHVLVGMSLATPVAIAFPGVAPVVVAGAVAGSILPDLDVVARHRQTLHFPTGYAVAAIPAGVVAVAAPTPATIGIATGIVAAAVHCRMDAYGGSHELRPWERNTDRAVYDHVRGEWQPAKRWVRYDGSRSDLFVSLIAAVPPVLLLPEPSRKIVVGAIAIAFVYTAFRRRVPGLIDVIVDRLRPGS